MPKRKVPTAGEAPPPAVIPVVDRNAVLSAEQFAKLLGVKKTLLAHEFRAGRLRVSKRAHRYFILGAWVLDWIEAGEVRRRADAPAPAEERRP